MKIKVSEATNEQINWLVAKALALSDVRTFLAAMTMPMEDFKPTTDWSQGGPIIEREIHAFDHMQSERMCAIIKRADMRNGGFTYGYGPTPLIAAMRCYVASKLGDEVEVPDVLV